MTKEIAKLNPGASPLPWGRFFGWDPELIPNMPTLSADFLDEKFSSTFPVIIVGQSGHVAWVNHKAFEIADVDIEKEDGDGFVKADGQLTGQLFEAPAIMRVFGAAPQPTIDTLQTAVLEQWKDYSARGFTTVTDLAFMRNKPFDSLLETISLSNTCPVRLALYRLVHGPENAVSSSRKRSLCCPRLIPNGDYTEGPTFTPNPKLWEAGVKIIADGSPHCGTAAVREPFLNTNLTQTLGFPPAPCYGELNYSTQNLLDTVKSFHQQGTQIAIHAHGERAIDQVIGVYEQALKECEEPKDMRHRVEHLGLCTVDQIARAAKFNLALSFFVCHLYFYAKTYTEHIFGAERTNRWTPLSEATKHGIRWSIHQDHATFPGPPLPFANLKTAVTRTHRDDKDTIYGPEYCVSIHEAMKAVTIDAAWQIHKDDILGSLTKNKKADLLILSKNPYEVDPFELEQIEVLETFLDGRPNGLNKTCLMNFRGGPVAKRKFENLRARYSREKRGIKKAKKSGTSSAEVLGAVKEASDTFPYLHFLDKHISPRATKSNLVEKCEESDHENDGDGDDENDDSNMDTSSNASYSTVEETESESTSPKAGSMIDHVSDSLASKQKKPKELSPRKSKHTTTKVDMELEVIKAVGEGLKNMCSSMQQQQPQAAKEEKDEDDFFGVFVASQLKYMDQSRKARAKYHINNIIFQVMMSGPSGDGPSGCMQDLNSSQHYYLG